MTPVHFTDTSKLMSSTRPKSPRLWSTAPAFLSVITKVQMSLHSDALQANMRPLRTDAVWLDHAPQSCSLYSCLGDKASYCSAWAYHSVRRQTTGMYAATRGPTHAPEHTQLNRLGSLRFQTQFNIYETLTCSPTNIVRCSAMLFIYHPTSPSPRLSLCCHLEPHE